MGKQSTIITRWIIKRGSLVMIVLLVLQWPFLWKKGDKSILEASRQQEQLNYGSSPPLPPQPPPQPPSSNEKVNTSFHWETAGSNSTFSSFLSQQNQPRHVNMEIREQQSTSKVGMTHPRAYHPTTMLLYDDPKVITSKVFSSFAHVRIVDEPVFDFSTTDYRKSSSFELTNFTFKPACYGDKKMNHHKNNNDTTTILNNIDDISITLTTQLSLDRMWIMKHQCQRWSSKHPISVAIYLPPTMIPSTTTSNNNSTSTSTSSHRRQMTELEVLETLYGYCEDTAHRITVTIVRGKYDDSEIVYDNNIDGSSDNTDKNSTLLMKRYPVNLLRNYAIDGVTTTHATYIDSDFLISYQLDEDILYSLRQMFRLSRRQQQQQQTQQRPLRKSITKNAPVPVVDFYRMALVTPAFEYFSSCTDMIQQQQEDQEEQEQDDQEQAERRQQKQKQRRQQQKSTSLRKKQQNKKLRQDALIECLQDNEFDTYIPKTKDDLMKLLEQTTKITTKKNNQNKNDNYKDNREANNNDEKKKEKIPFIRKGYQNHRKKNQFHSSTLYKEWYAGISADGIASEEEENKISMENGTSSSSPSSSSSSSSTALLQIPCLKSKTYEPYITFHVCNRLPIFPIVFQGWGFNKIMWIKILLQKLGYRLYQIQNGFVMHIPHELSDAARQYKRDQKEKEKKKKKQDSENKKKKQREKMNQQQNEKEEEEQQQKQREEQKQQNQPTAKSVMYDYMSWLGNDVPNHPDRLDSCP